MWARLVAFCTPLAIPGHPGKDAGLALLAVAAGQDTDSASRLCRTLHTGQITLLPNLLTQTVHRLLMGYLQR